MEPIEMLDEDKAEALIAEYSSKSEPYAMGEDKNGAIIALTNHVFKQDKNWDNTGRTNLRVIDGHAFIELDTGSETIYLRLCLLDPRSKLAITYLLNQVKHPKNPDFTADSGPYEILVTVIDARKNMLITGLNLASLSLKVKHLEMLPKDELAGLSSADCPRCQENANLR